MSPVYTGAATKYRVCGLCGRQARVVQPEADAGCFRQKSVVKSFRRKARIARLGPFFLALFHRGKAGAQDDGLYKDNLAAAAAYRAALRRNSCLEPQRKSRRRNRFSRPPPSGGTADEAGARPLRKALRTFLPARRKSSGGTRRRADGRICPASAQRASAVVDFPAAITPVIRQICRSVKHLREKRPPRRYSVFCISTASSAGVA